VHPAHRATNRKEDAMQKIHLMIIDPQWDFCDPQGALSVPGADADMDRLAKMIDRVAPKLYDIHVTLDTHHYFDISHPVFWTDSSGNSPDPFTIISEGDVAAGVWQATNPQFQAHARDYVAQLAANQRYPLCTWPPHCLIGTAGHGVMPPLGEALMRWEKNQVGMVDYVTKGSNFKTEHYSAVQADVPDPSDPSTMLNTRLIQTLESADLIVLAGEASSHCLKFTVEDVAATFDSRHIQKMVLLQDCCSPVPGFEQEADRFIAQMQSRGMQVTESTAFLAG
jgi:nicotinamidase/pyrazinamidase